MGDIFGFEKLEAIHGNAVCLARGCDTSLQQSRVLGGDIRRGVIRVQDGDGTNPDAFSLLDAHVDAVDGVAVSFGHGGGEKERC